MRVLYTHMVMETEGSQVHVDSFIAALRRLGDSVIDNPFLAQSFKGGKEQWSRIKRLSVRAQWIAGNFCRLCRTWRLVQRNKPDVLMFRFEPLHEFFLSIIVLSFGYPIVLEVNAIRSIENHKGRPWVSDLLDRMILSHARSIVVVSDQLKAHLTEYYGTVSNKIRVAPNGVDTNLFDPARYSPRKQLYRNGSNQFVVGFVGSFRPWHGIDFIVDIADVVCRSLPDVLFLIVGDGADRPRYEEMVEKAHLSRNFEFRGYVAHDAIPQCLASMDVVLAPFPRASYERGFYGSALKLFEYMAMEKAIIVPPLGQNAQVIIDGVSGFLIDSEKITHIAKTIVQLSNDSGLCRLLGRNARNEVQRKYTWESNAQIVQSACVWAIEEFDEKG